MSQQDRINYTDRKELVAAILTAGIMAGGHTGNAKSAVELFHLVQKEIERQGISPPA